MKELLERMMEAHRFWDSSLKGDRIVPAQHDFPCCEKYDACCNSEKSKEFWGKNLERVIKFPIKVDYTVHTAFSILKEKDKLKSPEGFKEW